VLPTLADALLSRGEFEQAGAAIDEALRSGDARAAWRARLARVRVRLRSDVHVRTDELLEELGDAIDALAGDDAAMAQAWSARGWIYWLRCRAAETEQAALRAIVHARAAGDEWAESRAQMFMLGTILFGPTPVDEGMMRCRELYEGEHPLLVRATAARALGGLRAMAGAFDEARALLERDRAILDDLGLAVVASHAAEVGAMVELLAGDAAAAERVLRPAYEHMTEVGDVAAPTFAAILARAVAQLGRDDEALALSDASRAAAPEEDLTTQVQWRGPRAVVLARQGRAAEAEALAREAVVLADRTDFLNLRADAYADLAAVAGDTAAAAHASALYEQKGNVAILARRG
jgi:tetratricopeptide (TPR) repeat protein